MRVGVGHRTQALLAARRALLGQSPAGAGQWVPAELLVLDDAGRQPPLLYFPFPPLPTPPSPSSLHEGLVAVDSASPCVDCGWDGTEPDDSDQVESGDEDKAFLRHGGLGDHLPINFRPICQFLMHGNAIMGRERAQC